MSNPAEGFLHRLGLKFHVELPANPAARQQAGLFEHAKMLGNRGQRHLERLGEIGDANLTLGETFQQAAAGGVGQRGEGEVELTGCIVNHLVKYYFRLPEMQEEFFKKVNFLVNCI